MSDPKDWYEDDTFWDTLAPMLFSERRLQNAEPEVDAIVSILGLTSGARILDLCCGVARHALEFKRRGFQVTGVDRTKAYLDKARKLALEEGLEIEFVREDVRKFCRPNTYDSVVNLFTSFGYFDDPEDDRTVVRNAYESLREGGSFLIELKGKENVAQEFEKRDWQETDEFIMFEERKISRNWSRIECRWIVLKGNISREFKISHRLYSAVELSTLLRECGFRTVDVYGSLAGEPYDENATRLIVIGHK
jgi:SAM-dependent methyltransferase